MLRIREALTSLWMTVLLGYSQFHAGHSGGWRDRGACDPCAGHRQRTQEKLWSRGAVHRDGARNREPTGAGGGISAATGPGGGAEECEPDDAGEDGVRFAAGGVGCWADAERICAGCGDRSRRICVGSGDVGGGGEAYSDAGV